MDDFAFRAAEVGPHRLKWMRAWPLRVTGAVFLVLSLVPLSEMLGRQGTRWMLSYREWVVATVMLLAVSAALAAMMGERIDAAFARLRAAVESPRSRVFELTLGLAVTFACIGIAWYCFNAQASTGDEMSLRFQARLLASRRWFAIAEEQREFFNTPQAIDADGRWFSQFPVGWPLLLAPAMLLRLEWALSPLLAGLAVVWFHRFLARAASESVARWGAILFAISPWMLFLGGSQENHLAALAAATGALAALSRWVTTTDSRSATVSGAWIGLAIGAIATIRPYDAALIAVPMGLFQLMHVRGAPWRGRALGVQCAVGAIPVAILLLANAQTTGHSLLFGYDALNGPQHRPGFHVVPHGFLFTPRIGLIQLSGSMLRLNTALFEWPLPGVAIAAAGMLLARRVSRWDLLLVGITIAISLGYWAYWAESYFARGPRFYLLLLPALAWFVARLLQRLNELRQPLVRRVLLLTVLLAAVAAWRPAERPWRQSGVLLRASALHRDSPVLKLDVERLARDAGITRGVVFVNESWRARLQGRLRVLGMRPYNAVRTVDEWDACALHHALQDEDQQPPGPPAAAIQRIATKAYAGGRATPVPGVHLSFSPTAARTSECLSELQRDTAAVFPYATFLSRMRWNDEGRLDGPVIYAIDFGERNERLRERFGDRTWYRLVRSVRYGDTTYSIVSYR